MPDLNKIEDTLFVPMLGRIYASENFPGILYDIKALKLKEELPKDIKGKDTQTQYTLLAGAVRSANMDRFIKNFLKNHPNGVIAELGCGLETTFSRCGKGKGKWYGIDLPNVIQYRKQLFGEQADYNLIAGDAFKEDWILQIRKENPDAPVLVTASGLLYYFERSKVETLIKNIKANSPAEIVFDIVNSSGMKRIGKYMEQVGHADASMYFYVDSGSELAQSTGTKLLAEEPYYAYTEKHGLKFITRATMVVSDLFKMVKMIHLKL